MEHNRLLNTNRREIVATNHVSRDALATLVHEIQHAIQEIEGFAKGGRAEDSDKLVTRERDRRIARRLPEIEAAQSRAAKELHDLEASSGLERFRSDTFARGRRGEITREEANAKVRAWIAKQPGLGERLDNLHAEISQLIEEEQRIRREEAKKMNTPYQAYQALAGEVEARNTSKRLTMTPEQRRRTLAEETEDVAREDQIVLEQMLGVQASEAPMFARGKVASSDGKVASSLQPSQQAWPMKPQQVRELAKRQWEQAQRKLEHMGEAEVNALARQLLGSGAGASTKENIAALLALLQHDMTALHDALGLEVSEPTRRAAELQRNPRWQAQEMERVLGGEAAHNAAKDAGRTRLGFRQWLMAHTHAFKEWFGDWEAAHGVRLLQKQKPLNLDSVRAAEDTTTLKQTIERLDGATNARDGRKVTFPVALAGKLEHYAIFDAKRIAGAFDRLFARAVPMFSETETAKPKHKDHSRNFDGYSNYVSKFTLDGEQYYVRFTVQHAREGTNDVEHQMHSAFVSEVDVYKSKDAGTPSASFLLQGLGLTDANAAPSEATVAQKRDGGKPPLKDFRLAQWLKAGDKRTAPKAVYPDTGEPTAAEVQRFMEQHADTEASGAGNGNGGGEGSSAPAFRYSANSTSAIERAQAIIDERVKSGRYLDRATRALTRALGIEKLTRAIGSAAAKALDKFTPESIKAGLVADYGLPIAAIDARAMMQGAKLQQLRKAGSFVEKLATMTNEEAQLAYDWMTNESHERVVEALTTLPDDVIQVLAQVRDMVDELGAEAVKLGLLSAQTYERNKSSYLHRSYAKHVLGQSDATAKKRGRGGQTTAILGTNLRHRGLDEVARMEQVRVGGETWWDVSRRSGRADENFIGRRLRRLERRSDAGEGTEALPGMEGRAPGRVLEVVYVPAGDAIPSSYKDWHDAGVWEVRDAAGDKLQIWRDYTAAERADMGEIKDVRYAIMATLQGMIGDVETARYLRWLSREYGKAPGEEVTGEIVDASEGYLRPFLPNEWVKVPETNADGTKAKRYGALAGKYVPGPVFNDIRHMLRNGRWLDGLAGDAFHTIMQAWKTSKTSLSPTVHVNNIMSNFVMADWSDVSVGHLTKAMRIVMGAHDLQGAGVLGNAGNLAARATGMADREAAREIVQRYKDSGGELGSWTVTETMRSQMEPWLEKLEAQAAHDHADMGAQIGVFAALQRMAHGDFKGGAKAATGAAIRAVGREGRAMIDLYGNEDAVFRLAVWLKAKEDGASDIEAGRMARRALLDYNINAPWIQIAKGTALPFISFSYRGFPLLARTLTEKPHKMMKFVLFATALNQLGLLLAGADDDDEVRRLLPDEKAGRVWGMVPKLIRMPWNDKNDSPVYLDIRRWIPMGDVFDVGQGHAALPLPPSLMPGGPLAVLGELWANKSAFTGKEITLETDTAREKAGKVAEHLYKSFMPNVPLPPVPGLEALDTWSTTNIRRALRGETDVFGREQSVGMAAAGSVGVKLGAYPPDVLRRNVAMKLRVQEMEIRKNISAVKRQYQLGRLTPEEARAKIEAQQRKILKLREEAARRMGAGEDRGAGLGAFLEQLME